MKKESTFIFCLLFLFSCKKDRVEIIKIAIATSVCHAHCPFQAVQIDSSLNYQYYGGEFSQLQGYYQGKFNKKAWTSLTKAFNKINLHELKNTYSENYEDWPIELIVYSSKGKKHVKTYYENLPVELQKMGKNLLESYKVVKLTKSPVELNFETTYQDQDKFAPGPPRFPPEVK